ncbi:MAG: tripartite tricarboxylate transporter substrate binding protein [Burkholderiales bacterium]|nr:tripartite tricarboxylate transporter substrate binding protein [Burkholderiales bacterium]
MDPTRRRALRPLAALAAAALAPRAASAQAAWPAKPVSLIVSYPPGGGADLMARLVAPRIAESIGQPVIVENRPGASGQIAAGSVTKAGTDGYTLLFDASSYSTTPALFPKSPYQGGAAFRTIGVTSLFPNVVLVNPAFPAKSVAELVALARAKADGVAYASSGNGSAQHLAGALFEWQAKVQMLHVPYKGGGPALNDVIGGQVPVFFGNLASTLQHLQSGRLRALAVTGSRRVKIVADLPTVAESGLPGYEIHEWNGLFAPVGTPDATVQKLAAALQKAMATPEVQARVAALGGEVFTGGQPEAERFVQEQSTKMAALIRERGIVPE